MKKKTKVFFRSFVVTLTVISCIGFGFLGIAKAYENMVITSFGTKKSAVEKIDNGIRVLDFEIIF